MLIDALAPVTVRRLADAMFAGVMISRSRRRSASSNASSGTSVRGGGAPCRDTTADTWGDGANTTFDPRTSTCVSALGTDELKYGMSAYSSPAPELRTQKFPEVTSVITCPTVITVGATTPVQSD